MSHNFDEEAKENMKRDGSKEGFQQNLSFDSTTKMKIEFPFDLNNLFNMSYSFDILKQSIEFIAEQ